MGDDSKGHATPVTDDSAGYLVKNLQHLLRRHTQARLDQLGITLLEFTVLSMIADDPGMSNADVARKSFVTAQTAHRAVARLVAMGALSTSDSNKGRVVALTLTPAGEDLLAECLRMSREVQAIMLADFRPAERAMFSQFLKRAVAALSDA